MVKIISALVAVLTLGLGGSLGACAGSAARVGSAGGRRPR